MPSDILSVRVTTEVVAEKAGEEPTLAVQVIVDKRVPVLGWVLMVSALFGLAAMVREWNGMEPGVRVGAGARCCGLCCVVDGRRSFAGCLASRRAAVVVGRGRGL